MSKLPAFVFLLSAVFLSGSVSVPASWPGETGQSIFCEIYEDSDTPHACRQTVWDEQGYLTATKEFFPLDEDGEIISSNLLEYDLDHFHLTGRAVSLDNGSAPVAAEMELGDEKVSFECRGWKSWSREDPDYPAYYLQAVMSAESLMKKLITREEWLYDAYEQPQAAFCYDSWGGLYMIKWGEGLANEWKPVEKMEADEAGNIVCTYTLPVSYGNEEEDPVTADCVSTRVYNPDGKIIRYSYRGLNCIEYDGMLEMTCEYEYGEDGTLSSRHWIKNDFYNEITTDTWYDADGKVTKAANSESGFSFYFYDELGEIADIYTDSNGTPDKYPREQDEEDLLDKLKKGTREGEILKYHFDYKNHSVKSDYPPNGFYLEETYSVSGLSDRRQLMTEEYYQDEECNYNTVTEYQFDDLRVPVEARKLVTRTGTATIELEIKENSTQTLYDVIDNEESGKREYYKNGKLKMAVWAVK